MIDCEHYKNYIGPQLTLAQVWETNKVKDDITEYIREFYGHKNNWNGKLYTFGDIFPEKDKFHFYVEFIDETERKHWFHGIVGGLDQYFNPPLAAPINQNL